MKPTYGFGLILAFLMLVGGPAGLTSAAQAATCQTGSKCVRAATSAKAATGAKRKAKAQRSAKSKIAKLKKKGGLAFRGSATEGVTDKPRTKRSKGRRAKVKVKSKTGSVVAMIRSMAPGYGVPAWFAVRIAYVESSHRPHVRGPAGEYGLFQLKCSTARGLGFTGGCGQLLDARTNIKYGLKHLQQAIRRSKGNLKLAASKHNGGLGRRSLVPKYVRRVFGKAA